MEAAAAAAEEAKVAAVQAAVAAEEQRRAEELLRVSGEAHPQINCSTVCVIPFKKVEWRSSED